MSRAMFLRGCVTAASNADRRVHVILKANINNRGVMTQAGHRSFSAQARLGIPQQLSEGENPGGSWQDWQKMLAVVALAFPVGAVVLLRTEQIAEQRHRNSISAQAVESSARQLPVDGRIQDFYTLQDITLGHGQYGTVSTAVDRKTGEVVAVKRIPRCKATDEHFQEEIEAHRHAGDHPNIVSLRGVFASQDHWYIVMELASGGELYDRLTTEGALEEWEVRGLLREMADAVAHIHSRGIVHGDIKPENLLLREPPPFARNQIPSADGNGWVGTKELVATSSAGREPRHNSGGLGGDGSKLRRAGGKVLLADFGSSFRLKKRSKGGVAGAEEEEYGPRAVKEYTAAYSAPEVVSEGSVDQKADVWSLGVIAYVMVKGHHPFDPTSEADEDEIVDNVVHADPDWNGLDPQAAKLIQRMLSRNPDDRPSAREVLESPWLQVMDHVHGC